MPKPLTINYDVEYNLNKESDVSPFMQAYWEGREAFLAKKENYDKCPYKDLHFSAKWSTGFTDEAVENAQIVQAYLNFDAMQRRKGKKS